jgi:hypothetical protein
MNRQKTHYKLSRRIICSVLFNLIVSCFVIAQNNNDVMPENAHASYYGNGWKCNHGFREFNHACVAIVIPDNAYASDVSYENGWKCAWGYKKDKDRCQLIYIPPNAYLDSFGNRWECERGYREVNRTCVLVKVPEHAFYVDSQFGPGWQCNRGYYADKNGCLALTIPQNAHIDYSGSGWECNPPFIQRQKQCELPDSL